MKNSNKSSTNGKGAEKGPAAADMEKVNSCAQEIKKLEGDDSLGRVLKIAKVIVDKLWDGDPAVAQTDYRRHRGFLQLCNSPDLAGTTLTKMTLQNYLRVSFQGAVLEERGVDALQLGHRIALLRAPEDRFCSLAEGINRDLKAGQAVSVRDVATRIAASRDKKTAEDKSVALLLGFFRSAKKLTNVNELGDLVWQYSELTDLLDIQPLIDHVYELLHDEERMRDLQITGAFAQEDHPELASEGKIRPRRVVSEAVAPPVAGAAQVVHPGAVAETTEATSAADVAQGGDAGADSDEDMRAAPIDADAAAQAEVEQEAEEGTPATPDDEAAVAAEAAHDAEPGEPAEQLDAVQLGDGAADETAPAAPPSSVPEPQAIPTPVPKPKDCFADDYDENEHVLDSAGSVGSGPRRRKIQVGKRQGASMPA